MYLPSLLCTHTNIHQAISSIWSSNVVLLIRLEAYSVYLPSLSMYTYKHTSVYIPPFGVAVLYFSLDWRPTACTYPASQCIHTNIHQPISPHLELQCCTFDYIGGLQRVPTQPLNVHMQTYISLYPPFGAAVLYFWLDWRPTACTYPASQCTHKNIRLYSPFGAKVLYFWLHWRPTACTYPASPCTHTNMRHRDHNSWLSTRNEYIGDERRSFFYKRCSNIAWNLHV